MKSLGVTLYFFFNIICIPPNLISQCNPYSITPQSPRPTYYEIDAHLNHGEKTVFANQKVHFTNYSDEPITELRFYMYLNSFKNLRSSFFNATSKIFGQDLSCRKSDEWGWITIEKMERIHQNQPATDLSKNMQYIQPDDHNPNDQSVLSIQLDKAILPGEKAEFEMTWKSKMPKTILRTGYNKDFYLFCHWYPQLGVWEQNIFGQWHWNCHQAFRFTEYYADFGVYDVHITLDTCFKIGASGCLMNKKENDDNTVTYHYHAEDVIDFAWSIHSDFIEIKDKWKEVSIHVLLPSSYASQAKRTLDILKFALEYLETHVGKYPYPTITVVCPPFYGLRSGLMEYPTLITTGSFYGMPANIRLLESLVVHEFTHQYFMAVLASNEKEEPWMDEGFVTYFEDRIIDAAFGKKKSVLNILGICMDNRERTRFEYTGMNNPGEGITARPGWEFNETNFKPLIYSKPATTFHTIQNLLGEAQMDTLFHHYFEYWKFKHPKGTDFMKFFKQELFRLADSVTAVSIYNLCNTSIYESRVLDYSVQSIIHEPILKNRISEIANDNTTSSLFLSRVELLRNGDWIYPVDVEISFENGEKEIFRWDGKENRKCIEYTSPSKVISAHIDPQQKLLLDLNLNNNSLNLQKDKRSLWMYSLQCVYWIQHTFQTISFLL